MPNMNIVSDENSDYYLSHMHFLNRSLQFNCAFTSWPRCGGGENPTPSLRDETRGLRETLATYD